MALSSGWTLRIAFLAGALAGLPAAGGEDAVPAAANEAAATRTVSALPVRRGLCVVLGDNPHALLKQLAEETELLLWHQSPDAAQIADLQRRYDAAGWLGTRIYLQCISDGRLPLADNLVDLIVAEEEFAAGAETGEVDEPPKSVTSSDAWRVLHPGGRFIAGPSVWTKPFPAGLDDWSHPYHGPDNNPLSADSVARAPYQTQFLSAPWFGPFPQVTVASGGRLFKAFGHVSMKSREWPLLNTLLAMDAFNGTTLWQRELMPGFVVHRNTMIATREFLYLADNDSCKVLEASTGKLAREIRAPAEFLEESGWKWMALRDGILYALLGQPDALDEVRRGTFEDKGWQWPDYGKGYNSRVYPWGYGSTLAAFDAATGNVLWTSRLEAPADSRSLCMNDTHIFCWSEKTALTSVACLDGRIKWRSRDEALVAAIGRTLFAQTSDTGLASTAYTKCSNAAVYFAGPQRARLVAVSAVDGRLLWQQENGNVHLILRGPDLFAFGHYTTQTVSRTVSRRLHALTGELLEELPCDRANCTRATGNEESFFMRAPREGTTVFVPGSNLAAGSSRRLTAMRPACQDGVLTSEGLLYWGPGSCDCNLSLIGTIALAPRNDDLPGAQHERLEYRSDRTETVTQTAEDPRDWPTYRHNNLRNATTSVEVSTAPPEILWEYKPPRSVEPTAPVCAEGLIILGGSDGIVRALDAEQGRLVWSGYTGGPIRYPPAVWEGKCYAGSGDGRVYCFDAREGRLLWKFRVAPADRRIPVYGTLCSTWPVASGVLVEKGVAYAAAGIAAIDNTYVVALDARNGRLLWENDSSGHAFSKGDGLSGVSVQGHLLLHADRLYLAGGNAISPAVYDIADGRLLNSIDRQWPIGPNGSELFFGGEGVVALGRALYAPRRSILSRHYDSMRFGEQWKSRLPYSRGMHTLIWHSIERDAAIRTPAGGEQTTVATDDSIYRLARTPLAAGPALADVSASQASRRHGIEFVLVLCAMPLLAGALWRVRRFRRNRNIVLACAILTAACLSARMWIRTVESSPVNQYVTARLENVATYGDYRQVEAVVLAGSNIVAAAERVDANVSAAPQPVLALLAGDRTRTFWEQALPAPAHRWGAAVDREGRVIVTLIDGRVLGIGSR